MREADKNIDACVYKNIASLHYPPSAKRDSHSRNLDVTIHSGRGRDAFVLGSGMSILQGVIALFVSDI